MEVAIVDKQAAAAGLMGRDVVPVVIKQRRLVNLPEYEG
jgi:hypothetical protein